MKSLSLANHFGVFIISTTFIKKYVEYVNYYENIKQELFMTNKISINYEKMIVKMKEFIQEYFFNLIYYYNLDPTKIKQYYSENNHTTESLVDLNSKLTNIFSYGETEINNHVNIRNILLQYKDYNDTEIYINAGINEIKEQLKFSTERKCSFPQFWKQENSLNHDSSSLGLDAVLDFLKKKKMTEENQLLFLKII